MGYNRDQIRDMFNSRMRSIAINAQRDQDEQDAIAYNAHLDRLEKEAKTANMYAGFATAKGIREAFITKKLGQTYTDELIGDTLIDKNLKYKYKEDAKLFDFKGHIERLFDPLEETKGYQEFQAKEAAEELKKARASVPLADEDEFFDDAGATATYGEDVTAEETDFTEFDEASWEAEDKKLAILQFEEETGKEYTEEEFKKWQGYEDIEQWEEDVFDTTDQDAFPETIEGEVQYDPDTEEFLPVTGPEADQQLYQTSKAEVAASAEQRKAVGIEKTKQFELEQAEETAQAKIEAEEFYKTDPITGEPIVEGDEISPTDYTVASSEEQQRMRLEAATPVPDAQGVKTLHETTKEKMEQRRTGGDTGDVPPLVPLTSEQRVPPTIGEKVTVPDTKTLTMDERTEALNKQALRATKERFAKSDPLLFDVESKPKVDVTRKVSGGFDYLGGEDIPDSAAPIGGRSMPDIMRKSPQKRGAGGAPITDAEVVVPDAKTDLLKTGKDVLKDVQTGVGLYKDIEGIGKGGEEGVLSGTRAGATIAKEVGGRITEKATEKAIEAGTIKAGEKIAEKGLGKGLSFAGKALGAGVGIYTGLKTAFSEDASAEQRWGGGLQALGSGLMATGIGAGLGAILTGGGTLLSMFGGGKKSAPAPAPTRPRMDTSKYYQRQRMRRRR